MHSQSVRRRLTLLAVPLALVAVAPSEGHTQPACAVGSLADYIALGAGGCTIAGFRFDGFGPSATTPGQAAANPSNILLTPFVRPVAGGSSPLGEMGFTVSFLTPLQATAIGQSGTASTTSILRFEFDVSNAGSTSILRGVNLAAMDVTRSDGAPSYQVGSNYYAGALTLLNGRYVRPDGFTDVAFACRTVGLYCMGFPSSGGIVGSLDLRIGEMDVEVYAEASASTGFASPAGLVYFASLNSFDAAVGIVTPEPSTYALLGTGLLALGGIARRRRAKAA
jgi:hypothetical protein